MSWEAVIGIEVHVQLRTERKLFCGNAVEFGAAPNTHVCPVCLGLPGALPAVNPEAVRLAVRTGLAFDCTVHERSVWARKNYVYPDLPKGYQITQFDEPIATDGFVDFEVEGGERRVRIRRVHMEEDAGKLLHDRVPGATAVDLNRAGTPLVEIVTEPDLSTPEEVRAFLNELKQILQFMDVSDCNMEEGSLRADANVSIRPRGSEGLGTKTEIKNVNSFSGIEKAVRLEIERQVERAESGEAIHSATLLWDDHREVLRTMRSKEESHDYRYFDEPDLPPLIVPGRVIAAERVALPERPRALRLRLAHERGLSAYDAGVIAQSHRMAQYFETVADGLGDAKLAANWVMGPLQALANASGVAAHEVPIPARRLVDLVELVQNDTISDGIGRALLERMLTDERAPIEIVEAEGLRQVRDDDALGAWVDEVIGGHPDEVARYREGETKIVGFLVGRVMRLSAGKADPRRVNEVLRERLG